MLREIEPLQGKPWYEQTSMLVQTADKIVKEYQSPFKNDAKGSLDCYRLECKLEDCRRILKRYQQESVCHSGRSEESR